MKNESLKVEEVQLELSEKSKAPIEMLDFSELMCVKGGKEEQKDSGNAGGLFCWC